MLTETGKEIAKYWSAEFLGGLECLYGKYFTFSFAPHFHDRHAVGVIETGTNVFDYRGKKQFASAGEIMILNPAEVHTGQAADKRKGWSFRMLFVDPELLRTILEGITGKSSDIPFFSKAVAGDDVTAKRIMSFHRAIQRSASQFEQESRFLLAMALLLTRHADSTVKSQKIGNENASVARAREYLHANACKKITLAELAQVAFLSPFHLLRAFHKETGLPPHAYQTQIRIERSKQFLLDDYSISQAALAAGFFDQAHFSKQFKRYVGVTPRQFLAKN